MGADNHASLERILNKYLGILGISGSKPKIVIRDRLTARWLGRHTWYPPDVSSAVIEIQKIALVDDKTVERVMAHEAVHHWEAVHARSDLKDLIRLRLKPAGHGEEFLRGAAIVNAKMGEGFVTKTSDAEYVTAPLSKEFFVLVVPSSRFGGPVTAETRPFGWQWAVRLSADARKSAGEYIAEDGAKLFRTRFEPFLSGRAKIKQFEGISIPRVESKNVIEELQRLYDSGPGIDPMMV